MPRLAGICLMLDAAPTFRSASAGLFLLGLDSFVVSFALGAVSPGPRLLWARIRLRHLRRCGDPARACLRFAVFARARASAGSGAAVLMICYAIYVAILARSAKTMRLSWPGWLAFPIAARVSTILLPVRL